MFDDSIFFDLYVQQQVIMLIVIAIGDSCVNVSNIFAGKHSTTNQQSSIITAGEGTDENFWKFQPVFS